MVFPNTKCHFENGARTKSDKVRTINFFYGSVHCLYTYHRGSTDVSQATIARKKLALQIKLIDGYCVTGKRRDGAGGGSGEEERHVQRSRGLQAAKVRQETT